MTIGLCTITFLGTGNAYLVEQANGSAVIIGIINHPDPFTNLLEIGEGIDCNYADHVTRQATEEDMAQAALNAL